MLTILIVALIIGAVAALPVWPYSRRWGYVPSAIAGVAALVALVALLNG